MDYCIGQLRLAEFLGARCAVNVAGAFGPRWDGHYKENFTENAWKETVRMVQEIIDTADVKNTYFTLEPMPSLALGTSFYQSPSSETHWKLMCPWS